MSTGLTALKLPSSVSAMKHSKKIKETGQGLNSGHVGDLGGQHAKRLIVVHTITSVQCNYIHPGKGLIPEVFNYYSPIKHFYQSGQGLYIITSIMKHKATVYRHLNTKQQRTNKNEFRFIIISSWLLMTSNVTYHLKTQNLKLYKQYEKTIL